MATAEEFDLAAASLEAAHTELAVSLDPIRQAWALQPVIGGGIRTDIEGAVATVLKQLNAALHDIDAQADRTDSDRSTSFAAIITNGSSTGTLIQHRHGVFQKDRALDITGDTPDRSPTGAFFRATLTEQSIRARAAAVLAAGDPTRQPTG